jgi:hypothetical protein
MIAYTYYESDTRVIREAEAAVEGGFEVDFLALRKPGSPKTEAVRGVRLIRVNQTKYRGGGHAAYVLGYLMFFLRCLVASARLYLTRVPSDPREQYAGPIGFQHHRSEAPRCEDHPRHSQPDA